MRYKFRNPFRYKIQAWDPPKGEQVPQDAKEIFKKNKVIPSELEEVFYEAIAYYPELKEAYIFVVDKKFYGIQNTLRAYPPFLSLLNKKENRVSPIVININKKAQIPFYSLTKEQQKGILIHELAHIADYSRRTSLELLGLAFMFCFSKSFVKKLESATDEIVFKRGGEKHLAEFSRHVAENATGSYGFYKNIIYGDSKVSGWRAFVFSVRYSIQTAYSFPIAITEMMVLVYVKKFHKKSSD